jgi:capsular polysaccharide transport system permease protein
MKHSKDQVYSVSLLRSFQTQGRVVGALFMREIITRFGRHNIGFIWLFVEPMMFTLGVALLWTIAGLHTLSAIPVAAFALTGYSSILVWRNTVNRCTLAITPNLTLMYHRNVRIIDFFIARIILEIAGATISLIILTVIFISIGLIEFPVDISKILIGWLMLSWFGASLGLLVGALTEKSEIVEKVWHPISYLLFPMSGAAFMVDWIPYELQKYVLFLPMVHGVEILREGFFGDVIHPHYSIAYMALCCLLLTLFGLVVCRSVGEKIEPND